MQVLLFAFHILVFPGLLFEILMGILLLGTCNKLVARMQNRVGPPIIQPWYDFLKCCGKETIVPRTAKRNIYLTIPYIGLGIIMSTALFVSFAGTAVFSGQSDLIVILYLLTFVSGIRFFGLGADEFIRYQFYTETGATWFTILLILYIISYMANLYFSQNKLDL